MIQTARPKFFCKLKILKTMFLFKYFFKGILILLIGNYGREGDYSLVLTG